MEYNKLTLPESLLEFARRAYANHDKAHNLDHVIRVWERAQQILRMENINLSEYEKQLLPYIIIGHDFRDYKLINTSLSEQEIHDFYVNELGIDAAYVISHCHNNCSWSKRKTSEPLKKSDILRLILQDADWLDALGETGLERCIEYSNAINKPFPDNVKQHIKEKLLLIENELNFQASKDIVRLENLNEPLYEFLATH
jgi:HD superfamily phosphodiesterase